MFKRFSSVILMAILAGLLVVYFIVRFSGTNDRTFRDKVLSFDPAVVTSITIDDPKSLQEPVELRLSGEKWMVRSGVKEYPADSNIVKGALNTLSDMPTKRFAGKGKESWIKYEVTDTSGIKVTLKSSSKTVAEILIGKFTFNMPKDQQQSQFRQQRGDMTSFVRLADEKDVYAVDGYLRTTFSAKPDSYRYKNLSGVNAQDITKMTVSKPGGLTVYDLSTGKWTMNGMPADSATTARYRSAVARLSGSKFVDPEMVRSAPAYTLRLEGNNFSPVDIMAYPVADTNIAYAISSSVNPDAYFDGKTGGLFKRIWPD